MLCFILLSVVSFAFVEKRCEAYCENLPTEWDTKCDWMDCADCTACAPKEPQCENWCLTHETQWLQKCGWVDCASCDPNCKYVTGNELFCPDWCQDHSMPWEQKCDWYKCQTCDECASVDEPVYGHWTHTRTYTLKSGKEKVFTTGPYCGRQSDTFEVSTFVGKHCSAIKEGETIHVVDQDGNRVSQGYFCTDQVEGLPELSSQFTETVACDHPVKYGKWTITRTYSWDKTFTSKPKCGSSVDTFYVDAAPCPHCDNKDWGQCMELKNQNGVTMAPEYYCTEQVPEGWPKITAEFVEDAECDYGHITITRIYELPHGTREFVSDSFCGNKDDDFVVVTVPCKKCTQDNTGECYVVQNSDGSFTNIGGYCSGVVDYPKLSIQFDSSTACSPTELTRECPTGYVQGYHYPGAGRIHSRGGGEIMRSCEDCKTLCDDFKACKGYECDITRQCRLNWGVSTETDLDEDFKACDKEGVTAGSVQSPSGMVACEESTCRAGDYFSTCPPGKVCNTGGCYVCPWGEHRCPRDQGFYFNTCPNNMQCHSTGCVIGADQEAYLADKQMCCDITQVTAKESLELFSAVSLYDSNYSQIAIYGFALLGIFAIARQVASCRKGDSYESVTEMI